LDRPSGVDRFGGVDANQTDRSDGLYDERIAIDDAGDELGGSGSGGEDEQQAENAAEHDAS
jgi:hypothetical protein